MKSIICNHSFLLAALLLILLQSCNYGVYTTSSYTPSSNEKYEKTDLVCVFFSDDTLDFEYVELGYVKAIGGKGESDEDVLSHLKHKARKHGANAIVQLDQSYIQKSSETDDYEEEFYYELVQYSGIAVRSVEASELYPKYTEDSNAAYIEDVKKYKRSKIATAMAGTIGLLFYAILSAQFDE